MSTVTDILKAVREVLLLQNEVERLRQEIDLQGRELRHFSDTVTGLDKRLVRIETMVEMATSRGGQTPRIEG